MMGMGEDPKHTAFFKTGSCTAKSKSKCSQVVAQTHIQKTQSKYRYLQVFISLLLATNYSILNKTSLVTLLNLSSGFTSCVPSEFMVSFIDPKQSKCLFTSMGKCSKETMIMSDPEHAFHFMEAI